MPYQRKTETLFVIQAHYGDGWEDIHHEKKRSEILARLREYRQNEPQYPYRFKRKREPISPLPK